MRRLITIVLFTTLAGAVAGADQGTVTSCTAAPRAGMCGNQSYDDPGCSVSCVPGENASCTPYNCYTQGGCDANGNCVESDTGYQSSCSCSGSPSHW